MKDDLHDLIDGELPDEQAAEVLHLLSVDPEKRSDFRKQMNLQRTLFRNERHQSLSSFEEGEMLERVMRSAGETTGRAGRIARRGALMLAVGFLIGSGAGYVGHTLVDEPTNVAATPDTVRVVATPTTSALNFDRDSLVAAIRDSLGKASRAVATTTPKKPTRAVPKRKTARSSPNDPTGRPEALKNNRR